MTQNHSYLDIILSPSRSLSTRGFHWLMVFLFIASLSIGGFFLSLGAGPVFGFFGLDIALLYWAFHSSFRSGTVQEHVMLNANDLSITRTAPHEKRQSHHFQPAWVKVELAKRGGYAEGLWLRAHKKRLAIGTFLPPQELPIIADMINAALARRANAMKYKRASRS